MRFLSATSLFLLAASTVAQQPPAPAPHDMDHMQHGGFMQGAMHHQVAQGVKPPCCKIGRAHV